MRAREIPSSAHHQENWEEMMDFVKWCVETEESVQKHMLRGLAIDAGKEAQAISAIAKAVPSYYTDPEVA